jgi:curved DNA-binding protein CbpA
MAFNYSNLINKEEIEFMESTELFEPKKKYNGYIPIVDSKSLNPSTDPLDILNDGLIDSSYLLKMINNNKPINNPDSDTKYTPTPTTEPTPTVPKITIEELEPTTKLSDKSLINPYELFGLTTESSVKELKKMYYSMALLVHPDKGGTEKEMDVLHKAYKYVLHQLQNKSLDISTKSLDDLEAEFKEFCDNQEKEPMPSFAQIYEDTNEWIKGFHREFEKNRESAEYNLNPFGLNHGYGNLMDKSEINMLKAFDIEYKNDDYNKIRNETENLNKKTVTPFNKEIIQYKEPLGIEQFTSATFDLKNKKVSDYSTENASDYIGAFSSPIKINDSTKKIDLSASEMELEFQKRLKELEQVTCHPNHIEIFNSK